LKVLRADWEKIEAAFKAKETITGKVVTASRAASSWISAVRAFLRVRNTTCAGAESGRFDGTEIQVRITS